MDGTTEPVVAVIGHPIAGNPSQFAFERALAAMQLEWRVISFDVAPDAISAALDGAEVLGLRGILLGPNVCEAAAQWCQQRQGAIDSIDCLYRDPDEQFVGCNQQRAWVDEKIVKHRESLGRDFSGCLWLGDQVDSSRIESVPFNEPPIAAAPELDEIVGADVIVIADVEGNPVALEADDWPPGKESTLVVDLTEGHPEIERIQSLGYQVLTLEQRRIGTLRRCLKLWTGVDSPAEVVHDAVEEYLAV
jgi:hypothetical protein